MKRGSFDFAEVFLSNLQYALFTGTHIKAATLWCKIIANFCLSIQMLIIDCCWRIPYIVRTYENKFNRKRCRSL